MTAEEPPPLPNSRLAAAAWSMWIFAAMFVVHGATAFATAPRERMEKIGVAGSAMMIGSNLVVVIGLAWAGARVRTGRSVAAACAAVVALGFMGLAVIVGMIAGGNYLGTSVLAAVQVVFGVAWLVAVVTTARAWCSR